MPYNKPLTNRACSGCTGEYWPSVVAVPTSLCSVRTATTSGQYSPVRPSRLVSKRLLTWLDAEGLQGYFFHCLCHKCIISIIAISNSNDNSITLYPQSFETICIKIMPIKEFEILAYSYSSAHVFENNLQ